MALNTIPEQPVLIQSELLGPYDSLNLGMTLNSPTVLSNPMGVYMYLNSSNAGAYGDGGA